MRKRDRWDINCDEIGGEAVVGDQHGQRLDRFSVATFDEPAERPSIVSCMPGQTGAPVL